MRFEVLEAYKSAIVRSMQVEVDQFDKGAISLGELVSRIRGLYTAAEIQDDDIETAFENAWIRLDHQNELRTEPWFPVDAATEEDLDDAILRMKDWIFENG
jgi:hypothetical protein